MCERACVRACVCVCVCVCVGVCVCVCTGIVRNELIRGHANVTVVDTNSLQVYSDTSARALSFARTHFHTI